MTLTGPWTGRFDHLPPYTSTLSDSFRSLARLPVSNFTHLRNLYEKSLDYSGRESAVQLCTQLYTVQLSSIAKSTARYFLQILNVPKLAVVAF